MLYIVYEDYQRKNVELKIVYFEGVSKCVFSALNARGRGSDQGEREDKLNSIFVSFTYDS